jgi:hypothetical protein
MEDNSTLKHVHLSQLFKSNKLRRWPWALGIMTIALCHATFFLPLRALVPVSPGTDPWWGMALVVADETALVLLIYALFRKLKRTKIQKDKSDATS